MKETIFQQAARQAAETIALIEPQLTALEAEYAVQIAGLKALKLEQQAAGLPAPRRNVLGPVHLRLPVAVIAQRRMLQNTLDDARAELTKYASL